MNKQTHFISGLERERERERDRELKRYKLNANERKNNHR